MTHEEFRLFQSDLLTDVVAMREAKGKEYATFNNAFANFVEDAKDVDITPLQAALMHTNKHIRAIRYYVREGGESKSSEPIRGRIIDAICYLTLIAGMIEEDTRIDRNE